MRHLALLAVVLVACGTPDASSTPPASETLLAPSLRRLSVAELERSAAQLLGAPVNLRDALPPDALQGDFSRNIAQSVDSLTLRQLYDATRAATDAIAPPNEQVEKLAAIAFRRPATNEELARLQPVFEAGGIPLVLRALLASPQFLYESSLGEQGRLSQPEVASALSFLISGGPPDAELRAAAAAGQLANGDERYAQAVRLLGRPEALAQFQRFVEEWLGLGQLPQLAKSSAVTADFKTLSRAMQTETRSFVADVLGAQGGSLQALFAGGYAFVPDELAPLYGIAPVPAGSRVSLRPLGRVGILQQASFLSVFAHEAESAPVLRGKAVLTRVLCRNIPAPQEFGIDLVFPAPDAAATTRQRFERHARDPVCRSCHAQLDPVGFTFENFDAIGRLRTTEAGQAVDSSGSITLDQPIALADSVALSDAIAGSEELRACAARQVVRFASGRRDDQVETAFVAEVSALPLTWRASLLGLFLSYVKSDSFVWRNP